MKKTDLLLKGPKTLSKGLYPDHWAMDFAYMLYNTKTVSTQKFDQRKLILVNQYDMVLHKN